VEVVIREGNQVTVASVPPGTVADALRASGIELGQQRTTEPQPGARLRPGMQVTIVPRTTGLVRTPQGSLPVDGGNDALSLLAQLGLTAHGGDLLRLSPGELILVPSTGILVRNRGRLSYGRVVSPTLDGALAELGLEPGPEDRLSVAGMEGSPPPDLAVFEGMRVDLVKVQRLMQSTRQAVPYRTRQIDDPAMPAGSTVVELEGAQGERTVTSEFLLNDGQLVAERVITEELTKAPQDRVVRRGTRPQPLPAPLDGSYGYTLTFVSSNVTAYCLTGTTASGTQVGPGTIAVDPKLIKLGSHMYVEGYGFGYARDTGGDIIGQAIDLWMGSCDDAIKWGRRTVHVYVLDH
jgi:3D (Asp-Asp-Asp) domain-containing protein